MKIYIDKAHGKMTQIEQEVSKEILNILYIQDSAGLGWTTYFIEHPEYIAEGDTKEEAKVNLFKLYADANSPTTKGAQG